MKTNIFSQHFKQLQTLQNDSKSLDEIHTQILQLKIDNQLKELKILELEQKNAKISSYLEILQKYPRKYKEIIKLLSVNK